jgi:hypothetical protein
VAIPQYHVSSTMTAKAMDLVSERMNVVWLGSRKYSEYRSFGMQSYSSKTSIVINTENDGLSAPPLSFGKHSVDVLSDFLTYLNDEVQAHIRDGHPYTSSAVLDPTTAHYTVIGPSHMSETLLRSVAKKIGIIQDEQHDTNMTFLTEEEANFEAYLNDDCNVLAVSRWPHSAGS